MNSYLILLFLFINILFNYFRSTSRISAICAASAGYGTGPPAAATSPSADDRPLQSIHTLPNTHTHYQTHTPPSYKRTVAPRAMPAFRAPLKHWLWPNEGLNSHMGFLPSMSRKKKKMHIQGQQHEAKKVHYCTLIARSVQQWSCFDDYYI